MQAWVDSMGSGRERRLATPSLAVMLILIMDLGGASIVPSPAETDRQERDVRYDPVTKVSTDIEGLPPVDCGGCDLWSRAVDRGDRPASEAYGWWFGYAPDADANGVDDRLQTSSTVWNRGVSTASSALTAGARSLSSSISHGLLATRRNEPLRRSSDPMVG